MNVLGVAQLLVCFSSASRLLEISNPNLEIRNKFKMSNSNDGNTSAE